MGHNPIKLVSSYAEEVSTQTDRRKTTRSHREKMAICKSRPQRNGTKWQLDVELHSFQNCEKIIFCCLSLQVYRTFLQQSEQTHTHWQRFPRGAHRCIQGVSSRLEHPPRLMTILPFGGRLELGSWMVDRGILVLKVRFWFLQWEKWEK